jgi:hypothetical protein
VGHVPRLAPDLPNLLFSLLLHCRDRGADDSSGRQHDPARRAPSQSGV